MQHQRQWGTWKGGTCGDTKNDLTRNGDGPSVRLVQRHAAGQDWAITLMHLHEGSRA
eukprot:CAMPEP_0206476822 /NCGR_PEP_ID=MMETSP0324_2-20121206/34966_1 /ASSEMBLY_ACC=CAM_ASM_000836 /TAXON_ID=2866 /ORGANISM="Crypthecodinium cohnii, Strain Seligo" /LENGTH=56 /DNA_ID=CAMNT_0053952569 /DNA_START=93 /DNA_END=263 /DNA_ORIENTATION=+